MSSLDGSRREIFREAMKLGIVCVGKRDGMEGKGERVSRQGSKE